MGLETPRKAYEHLALLNSFMISKQTIATYYKFSVQETDDQSILYKKLQDLDKQTERQKERVESEELPYEFIP